MWSFVMLSPINGKTSKKIFNKPDSEQMCQHGTRFQRRYLDWRATVIENATHIASERIHSTASSDQINNYKHVRNRLFERNKIGRTYLWTKFAKLSCPKLWAVRSPRDGPQRYSAESFWKLYVELTRILRERPQWLARDKHSISGKREWNHGVCAFPGCVSGLFWI